MAKKRAKGELTNEEAYKLYRSVYQAELEKLKKYGRGTNESMALYYQLADKEYKKDQVISSATAFARSDYKNKLKKYQEKLEKWTPFDGTPKPKKPHRDSMERYIAQMARRGVRNLTPAQADAIVTSGNFTIPVPIIDKKTGKQKIDSETGELLYKTRINKETGEREIVTRKATRNDAYYSTDLQSDDYFWNPIRERRKALLEEERNLGKYGLTGEDLSNYRHAIIAIEFFGSDPQKYQEILDKEALGRIGIDL